MTCHIATSSFFFKETVWITLFDKKTPTRLAKFCLTNCFSLIFVESNKIFITIGNFNVSRILQPSRIVMKFERTS